MGATPRLTVNGNHYPCPVCKGDPKYCPHSLSEMDERVFENFIRAIVRDEIKKVSNNAGTNSVPGHSRKW
jgi:hypothetical protein